MTLQKWGGRRVLPSYMPQTCFAGDYNRCAHFEWLMVLPPELVTHRQKKEFTDQTHAFLD